ncbi:probable serine/threonine-protein kinase DDB_G0280133 isoform X1 [Hydra vulgaris]|uniref:probable serine/threonine-protein kinase DDB_G0280133 isoform X1 n=1 Tax=Hydra vulgaris TaxID=6087 RepID=UPI001F5ED649|nr:probable serine/threonine-protein kinase DDB_G0280133 [Hydra vulgaris]
MSSSIVEQSLPEHIQNLEINDFKDEIAIRNENEVQQSLTQDEENNENYRIERNDTSDEDSSLKNKKIQSSGDEYKSEDEDSEPDRLRKHFDDENTEHAKEKDDYISVGSNEDISDEDVSADSSNEDEAEVNEASEQAADDIPEDENGKASFVPRRTGFWDHDDRFADINIEASREPRFNQKKLWDKSEVDRWQHDKFVESEQRPKEKWEIEQNAYDPDERRKQNGPRKKRQLKDYFINNNQNKNKDRDKNYKENNGYTEKNNKNYNQSNNRRQPDKVDEWINSNEHRVSRPYNNKSRHKDQSSEFEIKVNPNRTRPPNTRRPYNKKLKDENKDLAHTSNRQEDSDKVDKKNFVRNENVGTVKTNNNIKKQDGKEYDHSSTDENFQASEKSKDFINGSRRRRIEELPPRLQEKAREKADQERDKKVKQSQSEEDETEQSKENVTVPLEDVNSPDDGVPRDKPKRYSSQRQKTGTSMMDIPAQINEIMDPATHYQHLAYMQQAMYASQLGAIHQNQVQNTNIQMLEQQIIQMQAQLHQQQHLQQLQQRPSTNVSGSPLNMSVPISNVISPMVAGTNHSGLYTGDGLYAMNPVLLSGGEDIMVNPQINQMLFSQYMAMQQQHAAAGGLFVPPTSSPLISETESHRTYYKQ